jgi:PKD repeat protein
MPLCNPPNRVDNLSTFFLSTSSLFPGAPTWLTCIYTRAGVYTVTLSVSDGVVTDTLTRTNYISVTQPLVADFSADPLTGSVPLTVTSTNLSTPTQVITSALWAYGDGVISNTLALTHTHLYTRAGVYTVTLSVSDGVMTDTLTRSNYITATGGTVYTTTTRVITYTYGCISMSRGRTLKFGDASG